MPAKKKKEVPDEADVNQRLNKLLMEDSLALAATQRGINEDFDMEARERLIEQGPAPKRKPKK